MTSMLSSYMHVEYIKICKESNKLVGYVMQVLILSERLHKVTESFDQLRTVRFQETVDKKLRKRRKGLELLPPPEDVSVSQLDSDGYSKDWLTDKEEVKPRVLESRQQLMDEETHALQVQRYITIIHYEVTTPFLNSEFHKYTSWQTFKLGYIISSSLSPRAFSFDGSSARYLGYLHQCLASF